MSDKADRTRRPSSAKPAQSDRSRKEFARAIAKAEFGRFYWGEAQERALREAKGKRRKPPE